MKDIMLITHFIGLALGLGTSFAFMFLGMASSKMEKAEAEKFLINSFALSKMGNIGLILLFISGGYLMTPYWSVLTQVPLLMTKLILFLVLGGLLGYISALVKKAKQGNTEVYLKKISMLGRFAMLTGITIVIMAVLVFH